MILYVSKRFETNIASQVHYKILEEKFGADNIYTVDLRLFEEKQSRHYIAYGKYKNKLSRVLQWLQGNTMYISNRTILNICEIVEKYNCGICVDPHNSQQIKEAIQYLVENKEMAYQMGQNGRRAVLEEYNWESQAKLYIEVLTNI